MAPEINAMSGSEARDGFQRTKVFISYSRADLDFADKLDAALKASGFETLIDRRDIQKFEDWWARIESLIVQADTLIFVLTPDSLKTTSVCQQEINLAQSLNKRLAPIVLRDIDGAAAPLPLRRLNWIDFRDDSQFGSRLRELIDALETDIEWIRLHTRFGEFAQRWHAAGRPGPGGLMLRPPLLTEAEAWLQLQPRGAPDPTELSKDFIRASRKAFDEEQAIISTSQINLLAEVANSELLRGNLDTALKLCVHAARRQTEILPATFSVSRAKARLLAALFQTRWRLILAGHELELNFAAFSPDGAHVVTASGTITITGSTSALGVTDDTARVWDARTGNQTTVLRGHEARVSTAVFSPNGDKILTGSIDNTARIWNARTGDQISVLQHPSSHGVNSAMFSPDGTRVITATSEDTAHLWDVASAKEISVLRGHEFPVYFAIFSPDGRRIATASMDDTARVWDAQTGQEIFTLQHDELSGVYSAAFSPDGTRIVTGAGNNLASIWDTATGRKIADLGGHSDTVNSVEYSRTGTHILTASNDKTARVWDSKTTKEILVLRGHQESVSRASFSSDGRQIVTASDDTTARIWDFHIQQHIATFTGHDDFVSCAVYSPDGARVISASKDRTARIWDVKTAALILVLYGHQMPLRSAAFDNRGTRAITGAEDWTARIWDTSSGEQLLTLKGHKGRVTSCAFSPDGARAVTSSDDGTVRVWDAATGSEIRILLMPQSGWSLVRCAAFSPDGSRIITASGNGVDPSDNVARIWDVSTGDQIEVLNRHSSPVCSASFSPDGLRIVTASDKIRIWDATKNAEPTTLEIPSGYAACFSPDGSQIATLSGDKMCRIWDSATGIEIAAMEVPPSDELFTVAFSPDGKYLLTTHLDKSVRISKNPASLASSDEIIADACGSRLRGVSKLQRDVMRLAGYPDAMAEIDVCAGIDYSTFRRA